MFLSARVSLKSFCSRRPSRFAQIGPLFQAVIPRGPPNAQQILRSQGYRVKPPQPHRACNLSTPYEFGRDAYQQKKAPISRGGPQGTACTPLVGDRARATVLTLVRQRHHSELRAISYSGDKGPHFTKRSNRPAT